MKNVYILGPKKRKIEYVGLWQIHPFSRFKNKLKKKGYQVIRRHAVDIAEIENISTNFPKPDIIIIRPHWTDDPSSVKNFFYRLRSKYSNSKIIMIDPFDQSSSRFFESLPYIDAMIKFQSLSDKSLYLVDSYNGGIYGLEKLKSEFGVSPSSDWHVGSPVAKGQEHKIISGFFPVEPVLIDKINSRFHPWLTRRKAKDLDLFCHMSCGERNNIEWYGEHRLAAVENMQKLKEFNISVKAEYKGEPRISRKEYLKRLSSAKIVYSPLGWGEITMRPFEAIANDSLLIQPDVSHVDVYPYVLKPFESYVPVEWNLSDLEEKCRYYLEHESERLEIVKNARQNFLSAYTFENFFSKFEKIINVSDNR